MYSDERVKQVNDERLGNPNLSTDLVAKVRRLIEAAHFAGFTLLVTQGFRSFAEQDTLFNQWRDHKDNDGDGRVDEADEHVTKAAGGQSNHNYGLAVDFVFVVNGQATYSPDSNFNKIGAWASLVGLSWGGSWKHPDRPHVELKGIPHWTALLAAYRKGGIAAAQRLV